MLHRLACLGFLLATAACEPPTETVTNSKQAEPATAKAPACTRKGKNLWGKVQVVGEFADLKVQVVTIFPDLKVQEVNAFPDQCGKWQMVKEFPDFKIQLVNEFPDLKVQYVNEFPGLPPGAR